MRMLALVSLLAAACGDDVDTRPLTWSYIHAAIIVPNCATAGCHSQAAQADGVNFEDKALGCGYARDLSGGALLRGIDKDKLRMPPDQPLPDVDIELIEKWNAAGAMCD